jgi:agmatine deiminase
MISRRALLLAAAAPYRWRMPEETAPHKRTWMTFGAHQNIWGARLIAEVQREIATIAETISRFEPVSILVEPTLRREARQWLPATVEQIAAPLDDLWARDTAPVFVLGSTKTRAAVDFNFNAWGEKQPHDRDAEVGSFIARRAGAARLQAELILEAGAVEIDGHGTAIIAESCTLNDNRNPGVTKADFERAIRPLLGLEKIIWLPGARGGFTDGHTDSFARFAAPGVVLCSDSPAHPVTKEHLKILKTATDATGRALEVVPLKAPSKPRNKFQSKHLAASYLGFYACNGAILAQEFGDAKSDATARATLQKLFPTRQIIPLACDALAAGGGTIHRVTQQEPA